MVAESGHQNLSRRLGFAPRIVQNRLFATATEREQRDEIGDQSKPQNASTAASIPSATFAIPPPSDPGGLGSHISRLTLDSTPVMMVDDLALIDIRSQHDRSASPLGGLLVGGPGPPFGPVQRSVHPLLSLRSSDMKAIYNHTQLGTVVLVCLLIPVLIIIVVSSLDQWLWVTRIVLVFLIACGVLFASLTVEVRRERIACWFGPGLIRKQWPVSEVRSIARVQNRWFYGWGIRRTPTGWLYNVSGFDAVEIELASGASVRIGTDEPRELERAIRRAMKS